MPLQSEALQSMSPLLGPRARLKSNPRRARQAQSPGPYLRLQSRLKHRQLRLLPRPRTTKQQTHLEMSWTGCANCGPLVATQSYLIVSLLWRCSSGEMVCAYLNRKARFLKRITRRCVPPCP